MTNKLSCKHETLMNQEHELRKDIIKMINEWEKYTGVYISSVNYSKTQRMEKCEIKTDLILDKGVY